jgi:hypothetical protein
MTHIPSNRYGAYGSPLLANRIDPWPAVWGNRGKYSEKPDIPHVL